MPTMEAFKNVPELFEGTFEESLKVRSETLGTYKQLGPDDLVHVIKSIPNSKQQIKEVSSYHFVRGVDTSSSASIAAYINSLTYSLESDNKWFGLTHHNNTWNISRCVYCCFNAFEGKDVRVEAKIPGGVKSFVIDLLGVRSGTDSDCWQETFLSSILRCINEGEKNDDDDDDEEEELSISTDDHRDQSSSAKRSLNLLFSLQTEMKFLEAATKLFFKGRQLGSPKGPFLAGNHDNHLILGLVGYFCSSGRPEIAVGFLKTFIDREPLLNGLMLECLLAANNQGLAISKQLISFNAMMIPNEQLADFLLSRGDLDRASRFASCALKGNPSDFSNWFRICSIKISMKDFKGALKTLNNAPMFTQGTESGDFYRKLPRPVAISLPLADDEDEVVDSKKSTNDHATNAQGILEKLKGATLKGTYKKAYHLLVKICKEIGWDSLLQVRTEIFVMEQEVLGSTVEQESNEFLKETRKKLCERWLDNLFLILFEDLRIFELFKEELNSNCNARKSLKEWLLIGKLSERLDHMDEAKLAFQKCLLDNYINNDNTQRFKRIEHLKNQQTALKKLISLYCHESKIQLALMCSLRLLNGQGRLFDASLHPSSLSRGLCVLIRKSGMKRIKMELEAINKNNFKGTTTVISESYNKLESLLEFFKDAKIHGYDY